MVVVLPYPGGRPGPTQALKAQQNAAAQQNKAASVQRQPVYPNVGLIKLPFYDFIAELVKPAMLGTQGSAGLQEANFQFTLKPNQATDIASNRDIQVGAKMDYLYQIQLRFCPLEKNKKDIADEFPPAIQVHVNGKTCQLPNPIPTNKQGVEPKRPPKPLNISPLCRLSPLQPNTVTVKWRAEHGKGWVVSINIVLKNTADDLLSRLKARGTREASFTRNLIKKKLSSDDDECATDSIKISVLDALSKTKMKTPCRPSTCDHIQCFDASFFLQMNERKPKWKCPVCNKNALYDDIIIDGYYYDILDSKRMKNEENVVLERDGSWRPVPNEWDDDDNDKDENDNKQPAKETSSSSSKDADQEEEVCIGLSDEDDSRSRPSKSAFDDLFTSKSAPSKAATSDVEIIDID